MSRKVWSEIHTNGPHGRSFHSSCACTLGGNASLVITGGERCNGRTNSDMWIFNFGTDTWAQVEVNMLVNNRNWYHYNAFESV